MNSDSAEPQFGPTPLILCIGGPICGIVLGIATNLINAFVCQDYFAIVLSTDFDAAPLAALWHGILEGSGLGMGVGALLTIVAVASTRAQCPPRLAIRALLLAIVATLVGWILGGISGLVLAYRIPRLWGFFFVGVPSRVSLPRFAWVGGSIWGAYGGAAVGLVIASIWLHVRWRRMSEPAHAFPVLKPAFPRGN